MQVGRGGVVSSPARIIILPVMLQSDRPRPACCNACRAPDAKAPVHNFCHIFSIFFHDPVYPWTLGAYPDALPASSAFFGIDIYLDHNCNIQRSYITAVTK